MKTGEIDREKLMQAFHLFFEACGMTAPDIVVKTMYETMGSFVGNANIKEHLTAVTESLVNQYIDIARAIRVQVQRAARYEEEQSNGQERS
jgi:hypothetical protein